MRQFLQVHVRAIYVEWQPLEQVLAICVFGIAIKISFFFSFEKYIFYIFTVTAVI